MCPSGLALNCVRGVRCSKCVFGVWPFSGPWFGAVSGTLCGSRSDTLLGTCSGDFFGPLHPGAKARTLFNNNGSKQNGGAGGEESGASAKELTRHSRDLARWLGAGRKTLLDVINRSECEALASTEPQNCSPVPSVPKRSKFKSVSSR